jgi:cytochrome P450
MAKDLPESQRLSDEEIIYQIATFLLAGSETTSNAMTWVTYHLARNPEMQTRLRDELFTLDSEPSLDDLNTLPFLENVVRESLRVESVIPEKLRVTTADTMIPLSEPVVGQDGTLITSINAPKGTQVLIPICAIQHDTDTWGEDAREFIPDRFDRPNCPAQKVPGAWGNLLAFNGGAHNCM